MQSLFKQENVVCDAWKLLRLAENESAESVSLPIGPLLVPVAVWRARRRELVEREYAHGWPLGVWLDAGEPARSIAGDLDDFSVIAVHFPKATDGRGCFTARLLRRRYGYRGELRAFGEVPLQHLFHLRCSGFDAFTLRDDPAARAAASGLRLIDGAGRALKREPLRLVSRCHSSELPRFATSRTASGASQLSTSTTLSRH